MALHERRYEDSVPLFIESLDSALRRGRREYVGQALLGLAAATAAVGDLRSGARLLGASETVERQIGEEIDLPYARSAYAEALAPLVERAEEPEIAAALAAGRAMSESEAAAYALLAVAEQTPR